ncbi:hypothetical protein PGTUg99_008892 [Puccinia graminis f. sp. tritici]|uniref:Uncharacterized protein n=1 Tax=Puccinia graminis f. sp. tritici TaxID=56615 RepID=A0A5B0S7E4_PUCGR|nr:hypothetical protein PGTUg99_008892 [Puccinia graminis f. sp. tritici]
MKSVKYGHGWSVNGRAAGIEACPWRTSFLQPGPAHCPALAAVHSTLSYAARIGNPGGPGIEGKSRPFLPPAFFDTSCPPYTATARPTLMSGGSSVCPTPFWGCLSAPGSASASPGTLSYLPAPDPPLWRALIRDETISTAVPKSGPYPAFKDRSPKNAAHRGPHRRPYFTDFILGPSPDLGSRDWIGTMDCTPQWTRFRDGGGDALILAAVGRAGPSVPENPRRHSANVCYRF